MAEASYEREHLAVQAAGFINADGSTPITFGCAMTRINTGRYAMLLDANSGLVSDESFTMITTKPDPQSGLDTSLACVSEVSQRVKEIFVSNDGNSIDIAIEVVLFKSVTH